MVSERVFEEKTVVELQKMEEDGLIEYAKDFYTERKTNIFKNLNQTEQKIVALFDYEYLVISAMGFIDYFIIVSDYVIWAKKNGITVGPGR
jgi:DNA polymerase III alpha subunit